MSQSSNITLGHRQFSFFGMLGDNLQGISGVSANNNVSLFGNMMTYEYNYLNYIDRDDNNVTISIYSSSTVTEFPEGATFDLYVVTED